MLTRNIIIIFCCASLLSVSVSHAEPRTWTNKEGKTLVGELIEKKKNEVVIKKGEKEMTVKIADLSDEDQKWLDELVPYVGIESVHFVGLVQTATKFKDQLPHSSNYIQGMALTMKIQKIPVEGTFFIYDVLPGSPAEKAGISANSIFTNVSGFKPTKPKSSGRTGSLLSDPFLEPARPGGAETTAEKEYKTWSDSHFSKSRTYTIWLPPENGKMQKKTFQVSPEWKTQAEVDEILKARRNERNDENDENNALAQKLMAENVLEFVKPEEITVSETRDITEEEKEFAINFAQETIKNLRPRYISFKDNPMVIKTTVDTPLVKESKVWWTVSGSADGESTIGSIMAWGYKVEFSKDKDSPPKVEKAVIGTLVLHENPEFANYINKIKAQGRASKIYNSYITEEKKYDAKDYVPNVEIVDNAILIHAKRLFLGTQKIALHMVIDIPSRTKTKPLNQITYKYLGNRIYEVRCENLLYTKYSDGVYTDESGKVVEKGRRGRQLNYIKTGLYSSSSYDVDTRIKLGKIEEETMKIIDEYAIPLEDGVISFTVKMQHHPDGEGEVGWTFIKPPRITKKETISIQTWSK